jgi:transposase
MVLTAVDENTPVAVEALPGQVHEATQVETMLDATQARLPQIEEAVADKGFDGEPQRQAMASRRIATRYDKLKETFLGIVQLALAYICPKAKLIVNRA